MRSRGRQPQAPGRGSREAEVLVGIHPVREALRAGRRRIDRLLLRSQSRAPRPERVGLVDLARSAGVPIAELDPERFDRLAPIDLPHQGVALEVGPLPEVSLGELAGGAASCWLIAIDGIEDPRNLGAILRSAEAAGVRGVICPDRRVAPLTPVVARASAGALEHLPVASVTNLSRALEELKRDHGFWVHAAAPDAEQDLFDLPDRLLEGRLILVLGAEGRGLRPGVRSAVDVVVRIPMAGAVESLNVSAAAAVVLFEWARRARMRSRVS